MASRFDFTDLCSIESGRNEKYQKYHTSIEYSKKDGTIYYMYFYHKMTRTAYIVSGPVKLGYYGGSYIGWDPKTVKRDGKFTKEDQREFEYEKARKERLRWDESGEWM